MAEIFMEQKELQSEILGKARSCYPRQTVFFKKYFILSGMLGARSPSDSVHWVSFLSLDFFPFAAVLEPQCKKHLGQTESSQPLPSPLCCARKNTGVLSLWRTTPRGKIWGSDRGFGSTFRKQKAGRQRGAEFQQNPEPVPDTIPAPRIYPGWILRWDLSQHPRPDAVTLPQEWCRPEEFSSPWENLKDQGRMSKGSWYGDKKKSTKIRFKVTKIWDAMGCIKHQRWGSPAECDFLL